MPQAQVLEAGQQHSRVVGLQRQKGGDHQGLEPQQQVLPAALPGPPWEGAVEAGGLWPAPKEQAGTGGSGSTHLDPGLPGHLTMKKIWSPFSATMESKSQGAVIPT